METNCDVILSSKVKNSQVKQFTTFLKDNLSNVRNFEGCISVDILFNHENNDIVFYEKWESRKMHNNYIDFISNNGVMGQLVAFLTKAPEVTYFENLAI